MIFQASRLVVLPATDFDRRRGTKKLLYLASLLARVVLPWLTVLTSPAQTSASDTPCVFQQPFGLSTSASSCTPFALTPIHVIRVFRGVPGGPDDPSSVTVLSDGSAVVQSESQLFRIDARGQVSQVWPPSTDDFDHRINILGSVANYVVGIGLHGIVAVGEDSTIWFHWTPPFDFLNGTKLVGQDRSGAVWFEKSTNASRSLYAYVPRTGQAFRWRGFRYVLSDFIGPSGYLYATTEQGVVEVREPSMHARRVRGPIVIPEEAFEHASDDDFLSSEVAVDQIGSDGSAWAAGEIDIVHESPHGDVRVISLAPTPTRELMIGRLSLRMAPDGSAWIPGKLIRITTGNQVQVIVPPTTSCRDFAFGKDGTLWLIGRDGGRNVVFHLSL